MSAGDVHPDLPGKLRAPDTRPQPCKACGSGSFLFGVTDFNRSCEEVRGVRLPVAGVPVYYRRCGACGLLFTDAFDGWSHDDFRTHIYNAGYPAVDPDSRETRPTNNARQFARMFAGAKDRIAILDYGGGEGRFAGDMRAAGFDCETYDPIYPQQDRRPRRRFELVTSFETLEHLPDPAVGAADIASLLADDGAVFFSTLVQPADLARLGMSWWYIGPRNGHVTLFSRPALAALWGRLGFTVVSFNDVVHMAFRGEPPAYVREALAKPATPSASPG